MKKLSKIITVLVITILFLIVSIYSLGNYFLSSEDNLNKNLEEKMYITDLYKITGKYHIGKRNTGGGFGGPGIYYNAICNEKNRECWSIESMIEIGEYIYIYGTDGFGIFTQEEQVFNSFNELKNLPEEQQKILLDLKEKPRFIFE